MLFHQKFGAEWFQEEEVSEKRKAIRGLIERMQAEVSDDGTEDENNDECGQEDCTK